MNWIYGILALCLSVLSFFTLMIGDTTLAFSSHLGAGVIGTLAARRITRDEKGSHLFEWCTALFIPCFGGPTIWIIALSSQRAPQSNLIEEYSSYIDASERSQTQDIPELRQYVPPAPADVEPIAHILQANAEEWEKRNAIEGLLRLETPESISMLRAVLRKGSPEVKIYAASALSKLEERLTIRMNVIQRRLDDANDKDKGRLHLVLAQVYMDYILFDMIDVTRRQEYLEAALKHSQRAWALTFDPSALLITARTHMLLHDFAEAIHEAATYLELDPENLTGLLVLAESYFNIGRYKAVQRVCKQLRDIGEVPEYLLDAINIWI